jgi:hypothetical protein
MPSAMISARLSFQDTVMCGPVLSSSQVKRAIAAILRRIGGARIRVKINQNQFKCPPDWDWDGLA